MPMCNGLGEDDHKFGQLRLALLCQGEIVNILLKIKNSFLPTKQILIGL